MPKHQLKKRTGEVLLCSKIDLFVELLAIAIKDNHDLKELDLSYQNLSGFDFNGLDLSGSTFEGSNLTGANFSECELKHCFFLNADLSGVSFDSSNLHGARFKQSLFSSSTTVKDARLTNCLFTGTSVFNVNLRETLSLSKSRYLHHSGDYCTINLPPIVVKGLRLPVVFMDKHLLIGQELKTVESWASMNISEIEKHFGVMAKSYFSEFYLPGLFAARAIGRLDRKIVKRKGL